VVLAEADRRRAETRPGLSLYRRMMNTGPETAGNCGDGSVSDRMSPVPKLPIYHTERSGQDPGGKQHLELLLSWSIP
jgi:hypothetical protein